MRRNGSSAELPKSPLKNVDWSLAYVSFLLYVMTVTTQRGAIGTAAMVVSLAGLMFEPRTFRLPNALRWVFALVAWSTLGILFTDYGTIVANTDTDFAKNAAIACVFVNVITSRARFRFFMVATLVFFIVYPLRGTLTYYFLIGETMGGRAIWNHMYSNPNDLAGFCLLQFSIALGILETERARWVRLMAFGCAIILPFVILLTQSRGALVAAVVFIIVSARRYMRDVKKIVIALVLMLGTVVLAPDKVWKRVGHFEDSVDESTGEVEMTDAGASTAGRMEVWKIAAQIVSENPLGVGIGAYGDAHYKVFLRGGYKSTASGRRDTHSTYIRLLAERGFIGLFCFLGIVFSVARTAIRTRKKYAAQLPQLCRQLFWVEMGMYGYMVAGIWGSYDQWVPTYFHLMLVYCCARLIEDDAARPSVYRRQSKSSLQRPTAYRAAHAG